MIGKNQENYCHAFVSELLLRGVNEIHSKSLPDHLESGFLLSDLKLCLQAANEKGIIFEYSIQESANSYETPFVVSFRFSPVSPTISANLIKNKDNVIVLLGDLAISE